MKNIIPQKFLISSLIIIVLTFLLLRENSMKLPGFIEKRFSNIVFGDGTKPNVNAYPDIPVGYELPDTEEGLAEMEDIFMSEIPGEEYKK